MAKYTEEQIQSVCNACYEVMGHFTNVQNCAFPTVAIREGMEAGLPAKEIATNAYEIAAKLDLHQTGFGLVGMGDSMHNVASYMRVEVEKRINALTPAGDDTPEDTTE